MIWILGLLKGVVAHPKMTMGIAAVGVGGLLYVGHAWQVRGLRNDLQKATVALAIEKGATAELRIGITDVSANRDKLTATIQQQNASITLLQTQTKRAEASATASALRALRAGAEAAATLRVPTTRINPGHEAMNVWLTERFAR